MFFSTFLNEIWKFCQILTESAAFKSELMLLNVSSLGKQRDEVVLVSVSINGERKKNRFNRKNREKQQFCPSPHFLVHSFGVTAPLPVETV